MAIISSLEEDQIDKVANEVYEEFKRNGEKIPEWVKVMAHRPEILKNFRELFKSIMGKGEVEDFLKWKIAYVVSDTLRCPFCVNVTNKMLKKLGASDEIMKNIKEIKNLAEKEKDVLSFVKDMTKDATLDCPQIFEKLKKNFSEPKMVEIVSVIGIFNYINRFNNSFCILPE